MRNTEKSTFLGRSKRSLKETELGFILFYFILLYFISHLTFFWLANAFTWFKVQKNKKIIQTINAGEDEEQEELSFIASGNAKWYRRQVSIFLQN